MMEVTLLGQRIVQSLEFMATEPFVGLCFFYVPIAMNHIINFPKGTFNFMRCKFNLVLIISHHYTIIYKDSQHSV